MSGAAFYLVMIFAIGGPFSPPDGLYDSGRLRANSSKFHSSIFFSCCDRYALGERPALVVPVTLSVSEAVAEPLQIGQAGTAKR